MAFVAIEPAGRGLMPVAGLGIHRGDDPVPRYFSGDPEHTIDGFEVLAKHARQQHGCFTDRPFQGPLIKHDKAGVTVTSPGIDQPVTGGPVVPIDQRFPVRHVVITRGDHRPQLALQVLVSRAEELADR